jgi:tetratricopeptide (TPR) repeat protein
MFTTIKCHLMERISARHADSRGARHHLTLCTFGAIGAILVGCEQTNGTAPTPAKGERVSESDRSDALEAVQVYLDQGELASAEAILAAFVEKVDNDPRAWELYGVVRLMEATIAAGAGSEEAARERFVDAYDFYLRAIDADPMNAGLHQSAGEVIDAAGDLDKAMIHYEKAMALEPANPKPPFFAAQVYLRREEPEPARRLLRRVLEIDPVQTYAYASLAVAAMQEGRHSDAIGLIEEARRLDPHDLALRVQHARLLRQAGEPMQGLEMLVSLRPGERVLPFIAEEIAAGYAALGRPADVARIWRQVFEAAPGGPQASAAALAAATAFLEAGETAEARSWLERASRTGADPARIAELRAVITESAASTGDSEAFGASTDK